jgi:hypothetical protein
MRWLKYMMQCRGKDKVEEETQLVK